MREMPFIFSNRLRYRISRHLIFWLIWIIAQVTIYTLPYVYTNQNTVRMILERLLSSLAFLIPHLFLVYALMYFVIPKYVAKGRYILATTWTVALLLFSVILYIGVNVTLINQITASFRGAAAARTISISHISLLTIGVLSFWGLYGSVTIAAFALTIKLLKLWYTKEQKNIQLQKENLVSKTQLLQSQIHPHFLFNTLNNIYSSALATAPRASQMIMRLSSLLRYILYECNRPSVMLTQEIDMIKEYIALETMRYNEKLEVSIEEPKNTAEYLIAPLLLLPFVENCFKHGTSNVIEKPWINLNMQLKGDNLFLKLANGKAPHSSYHQEGIGIKNVETRLALLYPGRHDLRVINEDEIFAISLNIQLDKNPDASY